MPNLENLDLLSMKALRGSEDVKQRLTTMLSVGAPSIEEQAYAIKIRIKEDFKISEKVVRKRKEKSSDTYEVGSIRDIVGLRIVTLFRLDSLSIVPQLIKLISTSSGNSRQDLFLDDPIEEVVIYSTNPKGDAQQLPQRLLEFFETNGLKGKTRLNEAPSNYSSIHIVAWCKGKYRDTFLKIPVEIQIRTALEDVWGEIDHKLKYKRAESTNLSLEYTRRLSSSLSHLGVMKTLIDGIAQYGDQIKIQINEAEDLGHRQIFSKLAEEPLKKIESSGTLPQAARDLITQALGTVRRAIEAKPSANSVHDDVEFESALALVREVRKDVTSLIDDKELLEEVCFVLDMETALLQYTIGRLLGASSGNEYLIAAKSIYEKLEDEQPTNALVRYRSARASEAIGDTHVALSKLNSLYSDPSSFDLDNRHWVYLSAKRLSGVLIWEAVEDNRASAASEPNSHEGREYCSSLDQSIRLSLEAFLSLDDYDIDAKQRLSTVNNLLYFTTDRDHLIIESPQAKPFFVTDVPKAVSDSCYAELSAHIDDGENDVDFRRLDTLWFASCQRGDTIKGMKLAKMLQEKLTSLGYMDRGGSSAEQRMLRSVASFLKEHDEEADVSPKP